MNFEFRNPVRVVFGPGRLSELGTLASGIGTRVAVIIGQGSVKVSGVLDRATKSIRAAGLECIVFEGVEPNPRISTVRRGVAQVRAFKADVVVAIGGGSVMDAAKVIAAGARLDTDPWNMCRVSHRGVVEPESALPVITVPTLAATGSEMNCNAVITNEETSEKAAAIYPALFPAIALIDPELTLSVPKYHTAAGVVDIITHVTEGYFNALPGNVLQDRLAEGLIATTIESGAAVVADGANLSARETVMWCSTVALNGWIHVGWNAPFPCHAIEHVLSAHYDISHGAGLSIVSPAWMRFVVGTRGPGKWVGFARRVMGVVEPDDAAAAVAGIDRLETFFKSLKMPTRLSDVRIPAADVGRLAEDTMRVFGVAGLLAGRPALSTADIQTILNSVR